MEKSYNQGKLLYAGPFASDKGGLAVLSLANEAEACQILAEEPAILQQVFVADSYRWHLTFDITQNRTLLLGKQALQ